MATLAEVAKLLEVSRDDVKRWAVEFAEHLAPAANPTQGRVRQFGEADLRVLALVAEEEALGQEADDIRYSLNSNGQFAERFVEFAVLNTPLFQEPPEGLDDPWQHGVLIGGIAYRDWRAVARSYKETGDALVASALKNGDVTDLAYPVIFNYRQTVELYLKGLLDVKPRHHDLGELVRRVEEQHKGQFPAWMKARILDFHEIDQKSDMFRYAEPEAPGELWVDLNQLRAVMDRITTAIDPLLARRAFQKRTSA